MDDYVKRVSTKAGINPNVVTIILQLLSALLPMLTGLCPTPTPTPTPAQLKNSGAAGTFGVIRAYRQAVREGLIEPLPPRQVLTLAQTMVDEATTTPDQDLAAYLAS